MRAGCFAEDRVIDLINRRFVAFYFNRSGLGEGGDDAATKFVNGQTENPHAYFAAFRPTGEILGEVPLYSDKETVAEWLRGLLRDYPEYGKPTDTERAVLDARESPEQRLQSALLAEELCDYSTATTLYEALADGGPDDARVAALCGLLRIARYGKQWEAHARYESELRDRAGLESIANAGVERGFRLIAQQDYAGARALLQPLTRALTASDRLAEAHFLAGVACWFTDDRDWAKLHWCWILEHLGEDRLAMRARIAAAAEGMPYRNAELGGFVADVGMIGTHHIVSAVYAAMDVYRQMLPLYEASDFTAKRPADPILSISSPTLLIAQLRDGNEHVKKNNRIVDQLEKIGIEAIAPLRAAIEDRRFPGRGYAALALSGVLLATKSRDPAAMATLHTARRDEDPYVAEMSRSGLSRLE